MTSEIHKDLALQLKDGDENAFETIFKSFYAPLVSFANGYLNESDVSKNLVQDVFLKLWENHTTIDVDANLKSFLYTSTRNMCISHLRHIKTRENYFEKTKRNYEDLMLNYEALSQLDFDKTNFEEIEAIINETVESLSPRCKEVFMMSRYDELSNKEIADKLGITVKAVEANISRALKQLRSSLKEYLHPAVLAIVFEIISKN